MTARREGAPAQRSPETEAKALCKDTVGVLTDFPLAELRKVDGVLPTPGDAIATMMHLLQLISGDVHVRWDVARGIDDQFIPRFKVSIAVAWWRTTNERSVGPGLNYPCQRKIDRALIGDGLLYEPSLHPNARKSTQAQDQVFRRGFLDFFASIRRAKQFTAQRLLDEFAEGDCFRRVWNNTWVCCRRCGHQVVQRRHLYCDPQTGHISILSQKAKVAHRDYAQLAVLRRGHPPRHPGRGQPPHDTDQGLER